MESWTWYPGFKHLYFVHKGNWVVVCSSIMEPPELDRFRCQAQTVPGRLRVCMRWIQAHYWVQPPLWEDLDGYVN